MVSSLVIRLSVLQVDLTEPIGLKLTLIQLAHSITVSSRQPPGSTFKPLMGLIGLEEGLITPSTNIPNTGGINVKIYRDIAQKVIIIWRKPQPIHPIPIS